VKYKFQCGCGTLTNNRDGAGACCDRCRKLQLERDKRQVTHDQATNEKRFTPTPSPLFFGYHVQKSSKTKWQFFGVTALIFAVLTSVEATTPATGDLLHAFRIVESSDCYQAIGDSGKAQGAYQFHIVRWVELGGKKSTFGHATPAEQDAVMLQQIHRGLAIADRKHIDPIVALGNLHNAGHISTNETKYTAKLRKALAQ
jgi:hypothetical protein